MHFTYVSQVINRLHHAYYKYYRPDSRASKSDLLVISSVLLLTGYASIINDMRG